MRLKYFRILTFDLTVEFYKLISRYSVFSSINFSNLFKTQIYKKDKKKEIRNYQHISV